MGCAIQTKKPQICRDFPVCAANIKYFDKCTFKFDAEEKRSGVCCDCDQCCVRMPWPAGCSVLTAEPEIEKRFDEDGNLIRDSICRFLI